MKRALVLAVPLALAGCEFGAEIVVVGSGPQPRFDVSYDRGKRACVQGLTVAELSAGARRDIWAIRRIDRRDVARCVTSVTFGVVPTGYETAFPLQRLIAGKSYEVRASGSGWHAKVPMRGR